MFEKAKKKPYSQYMLLAIAAIKQHMDEDPFQFKTAGELLNHLNTPNRYTLEKAFKDIYATGIKEYQVKQRLEKSKKFLEAGMNKKLIASKCHYSGLTAYGRAFKKEFKVTPTEWLNLNR